ncbi:serine protease [Coprinopsis cinerea okayama7|uniref:Serine protease n=1 Tax=Coprinopsis cinerea (strain Okayama-7 / 130 / ATCC MYA-4618 / FGSC 9003) TaxID=240176 RepID=A8P8R9_COPC7|nr:serine protease [Coprinopsis cinerea okayama7\|eukprot:XP_001839622.1 serine protease [Coprinopsis cinerea okayama7\
MKFFSVLAAGLAVIMAVPTLAAPAPAPAPPGRRLKSIERFQGATTGKYIVKFKKGASRRNYLNKLKLKASADWDILNGFAADLDEAALEELRASDDVEYVAEDGIMHAFVTQTNAPWGLQRITQPGRLASQSTSSANYNFTYDASAGAGVDIYVVDTGVQTSHSDFGGRARWGVSYVSESTDGNGHGTHCAGTAAGTRFGVAKRANIIAVQVLNRSGSGATSGIVSGLQWVLNQARASGRPSVVSMSLGGGASTATDNAVAQLTAAGIHVVVAAGNSNVNAANTSPARAPSAITVAASTIADAKASYSNYGAVIDVWAPGSNILSAWIGSNTATNNISGTSMATPHVAGVVAYLIGRDGNISPAAMATKIKNLAVKNVLSGVPSGTTNALLQI